MNPIIEFKNHYFDPTTVVRLTPLDMYDDRWPLIIVFSESYKDNPSSSICVQFDTEEERKEIIMEIMAAVNKAKHVPENSSGKKIFAFVSPPPAELVGEDEPFYVILVAKDKEEALSYMKEKSGELTYDWKECDPATALENSSCCVFRRN